MESLVNVFEELILLAITSLSLVAELVVMEHEQPVIETSSVSAARKYLSTTPPCTRGRPKSRFSTTVTGNSSDSDNSSSRTGTYRIEVGDRLATTGHMDETVLHSVDDVQPVKPSFPASGSEHRSDN